MLPDIVFPYSMFYSWALRQLLFDSNIVYVVFTVSFDASILELFFYCLFHCFIWSICPFLYFRLISFRTNNIWVLFHVSLPFHVLRAAFCASYVLSVSVFTTIFNYTCASLFVLCVLYSVYLFINYSVVKMLSIEFFMYWVIFWWLIFLLYMWIQISILIWFIFCYLFPIFISNANTVN